jgi:RNA polymerase sigma-70 factor (ECF subfamily)
LTAILKHKIIDFFRRNHKQKFFDDANFSEFDKFFKREDEWDGHWNQYHAPIKWHGSPADNLERSEFQSVLNNCLSKLPEREASVFTLREIEGLASKEICESLAISTSNFWVLIHRARMHLRKCIEINWFTKIVR